MLDSINLSNFKPFGEENQQVKTAPITLIYGPNSAGKSSIIQSLLLMRQTLSATQNRGEKNLISSGELVNLGGFISLIHRHEKGRKLSLGYEFTNENSNSSSNFVKGVTLTFKNSSNNGQSNAIIEKIKFIAKTRTGNSITFALKLTRNNEKSNLEDDEFEEGYINNQTESIYKIQDVSDLKDFIELAYQSSRRNRTPGFRQTYPEQDYEKYKETFSNYVQKIRFRFPLFSGEYLIPFKKLEDVNFTPQDNWNESNFDPSDLPDIGNMISKFDLKLKENLIELSYLGPLRAYPERIYSLNSYKSNSVGSQGEKAIDLLYKNLKEVGHNDSYLRLLNEIFIQFEIPYSFNIKPINEKNIGEYIILELLDKRTNVPVSLTDVGFGIGQLIPILVEGLAISRRLTKIICVEQPEIHLHPRLQASLADFFIESSRLNQRRGTQWFIETHSEALILRIQRRIREGLISPKDVSVLYVETCGEIGSQIKELRLDTDGQFIDLWPDGFFVEGLNDILGGFLK